MDKFAPTFRSLGVLFLGAVVALVGLGAVEHLRWVPSPPKPTPAPAPAPTPAPAPAPAPKPDWFGSLDGLHYNDRRAELIASMPKLRQAAPHLLERSPSDGKPILLYRAWTDLFKAYPPYPAQQIGDCVSFGHGHANDLLQCIEFCLANPGKTPRPADIQETDTEFIYGASREISGNLGPFDGSYGAAAAKAMTEWGMLSRRQLGSEGSYSGQRAKLWGRRGVPDSLKAQAAKFKLGSVAQVSTWDELVAAIGGGHPVTICSDQGFTLQRDSQGFCRARGRWGHCMFIAGVRFDRPGACIVQSWGPDTPSGPTDLDQPSFSFWADRDVIERILSQGDSWALSKSPSFGQGATAKGKRRLPAHWRKTSFVASPAPLRRAA